jgi:quinolinate synthase
MEKEPQSLTQDLLKQDIKNRILELKKERGVVILAHYYVPREVQEVADFVGDSYYLSQVASEVKEDIILFCGVNFMGESAKLLSPGKTVLMPDLEADCPMAHMSTLSDILKIRSEVEDLAVVCYINSTAEIKNLSDVCVTSSNALQVINGLPNKNIYFIPDENLGRYIASLVPDKSFIFNDGYCHVHAKIRPEDIKEKLKLFPDAKVAAHPECKADVLRLADYVGSTSGIIRYVQDTEAKDFIICTETGVFHEIQQSTQGKTLHPASSEQICPDMKKNTLDKVLWSLESMNNTVELDPKVMDSARQSLERMLLLAKVKSDE